MSSKFKDMIASVKDRKEVEFGKEIRLEAEDYKALCIAAFEIFGPVLLAMLGFFALIIFVMSMIWMH